ncbi:hypothetical protein MP638_000074 [Amoeboaphelidium occidentale]|nr:hypothetical protein MP638_000074 [Amoeboaphelidium occidentale]
MLLEADIIDLTMDSSNETSYTETVLNLNECKDAIPSAKVLLNDFELLRKCPTLPKNTVELIQQLLNNQKKWNANDIVSKSPPFSFRSLRTLMPGKWLDDDVINTFGEFVLSSKGFGLTAKKGMRQRLKFIPSYFYLKLNSRDFGKALYDRAYKLGRFKNVSYKDTLLIPVNPDNKHWILVGVSLRKRIICLYDSRSGFLTSDQKKTIVKKIINFLDIFIKESGFTKYIITPKWQWKLVRMKQQRNSHDCGLFVCIVMLYFALMVINKKQRRGVASKSQVLKSIPLSTAKESRFWRSYVVAVILSSFTK